jgi:N-acetyl-beta-hexosaminidase
MYRLFPIPKHFIFSQGYLPLGRKIILSIHPSIKESCHMAGFSPMDAFTNLFVEKPENYTVSIHVEQIACHQDGYQLQVNAQGIRIACHTGAGLFYAIQSLIQMMEQEDDKLAYVTITDEPSLDIRGILLDIGRDKIPNRKTFYYLIDLLASMRINHVELYMEGFCFDYPDYRYLFSDETPVTAAELKDLSSYAKAHFIDLVPNQNVLGHMEKWLAKPQLKNLAECEDGYLFENLYWRPPMTLDVQKEESFQFVTSLLDQLLENTFSDYINVNMDEPFELGMGKNKDTAEQNGRLSLYFEFLDKIHDYCKRKGKKMLMWGDEILHHPECVSAFPKDVILLDWIYEGDANFDNHAKLMQTTGLRFCLCPGTSSWGSLTGRSDNMAKNIYNAAACAIKYGGLGIITTDWGDLGHWQYISTSFPGFAYTAYYSWSGPQNDSSPISWFCNHFIYQSADESAFQAAWDLGNYYHHEHAPLYNTTLAFAVMSSKCAFRTEEEFDQGLERLLILSANIAKTNHIALQDAEINIDFQAMDDYLNQTESKINEASLSCPDANLIKAEMKNGLRMVKHGIELYRTMKFLRTDREEYRKKMRLLFMDLEEILKAHYSLWASRNRLGGFQRSSEQLNHLLDFYYKRMK